MLAEVRAQLAAQEIVLKTMGRWLIERRLITGPAAAADLEDAARQLTTRPGQRVVELADPLTAAQLRAWAEFFRDPFSVPPEAA